MSARQGVQLGAAAVGFAVGAYFGQPQLGLAVGSLLGAVVAQVAFPLDPIVNRQDNVADIAITSAALGVFKPIVYGVWPLGGNLIWIYPPLAIEHSESSAPDSGKGGFGGPKQVTITTTYRRHGMVALCEGPINRLTRIYVDATLLYDEAQPDGWNVSAGQPNGDPGGAETLDPPDTILYEKASADQLQKFVLFRGTATQEPWAFAESLADVGPGALPAYRHTAVVGFTLDLGPTGRLPNLRFEVSTTVDALGVPQFVHWLPTDHALWTIWTTGPTALTGAGFAVQYDPFAVTPVDRTPLHVGLVDEPQSGNRTPAATARAQSSAGQDAIAIQRANGTLAMVTSTGALVVDDLDPRTEEERAQQTPLLTGYPSLCARPNAQDGRVTTLAYSLGQIPALGQCETQSASPGFQRVPLPGVGFQVVWNGPAAALYVSLPSQGTVARLTGYSPLVLVEEIPCGTEPTALLVASDGTCWVTDQAGDAVYQFTTTADRSPPIVVGAAPGSLAEATDGALWVALQGDRLLARLTLPGPTVTPIPLPDFPSVLAAGLDGTCWAITPASRMVYQVQPDGTTIGMQVPRGPQQLAVDEQGTCWVVCAQARAVVRLGADATTAAFPEAHNALACVVRDLNLRAGMPPAWIDVSGLDATPVNYAIFGSAAATRPLEDLAMSYQFLAVETGTGLRYLFKGGSPVATIAEAASLASDDDSHQGSLTVERAQPQEIPTEVTVVYPAPARHFHTAEQTIQRPHDGPRIAVVHNSPVAFDDAQMARNLAEILLYEPGLARYAATVALPPMASRLEPGDLVTLTTTEGQIYDVRLTKSTTGSDNRVHWETVRHRSYLYEDFAAFPAEEPGGVIVIQRPAAVELFVVEYPPLDDDVESLRLGFAVCRSTGVGDFFPVTTIFESTDGGASYQAVMLYQTAATVGTVASVSPVVQLHTWDRVSVLTVVLRPGSPPLTSASEEAPHYAMLGEECVAFVHVTATALETYELRILRRGSRGTEQRLPSGAPVSFVLLNAVLRNRTRTLRTPDIGLTRHYKAVPSGTNIAAVTEQAVPFRGVHGRPWAPVSVQASRSDTGVWTITWLHRSRVRGTWIDLSGITYDADDLGQDDVTVYTATDPPVAVQTYRPTHPARAETPGTLVYTLALQEEDFGSAQAALTVGVRHLRAGLLGEETRLQTTTGWRWDGENVAWPPAVIPTWYATFD